MHYLFLYFVFSLFCVGCTHQSKRISEKRAGEEVALESKEKKLPRTYVVMESFLDKVPEWVEGSALVESEANYRYFVSDSHHYKKNLCLRSAQVRVTGKIAKEVTRFIKETYLKVDEADPSDSVITYIDEQLEQVIQVFFVGLEIYENYWEKRFYKISLGARKDRTTYTCSVLVRMEVSLLEKALTLAHHKLLYSTEDIHLKNKIKKMNKQFKTLP